MDHGPTAAPAAVMIDFTCPDCGRQFRVKREFAGRSTACPTCKRPLVVPAPAEPTVDLNTAPGVTQADSTPTAALGPAAPLYKLGPNYARPVAPDPFMTVSTDPPEDAPGPTGTGPAPPARPARGRYVVGAEIARGGMGMVLQATDGAIHRAVAVKYLLDGSDPALRARFIEEAQITGQLEHPNIVPVHEVGIDDQGRLFFAMKLVKGRSLAQILKAQPGPEAEKEFSQTRLLNIFVGVCNALAYAHSRGVVHRDLKPANVMVGDFGEVYVMDWGLAKVLRADRAADGAADGLPADTAPAVPVVTNRQTPADMTQDGSVLGTPVYMSPEQAAGDIGAIDERSDVYALGAILYEILTLQPPVERDGGTGAVLQRVGEGKILPPAQRSPERARAGRVPRELAAVAMKALARWPRDRYQSAEFLRRDIERYLEGRSVSAKDDTHAELLVKFVKRNRAFSAVTAAAALLLAVTGTWALIVNVRARRDAEDAYHAYEAEQKEKEARTRQIVPSLLQVARLEVEQGRVDEALKQVGLVLEYAPGNLDARLLRARLLIARQDLAAAAAELDQYLTARPEQAAARDLRALCAPPGADADADEAGRAVETAQALKQQGYPSLAEALLQRYGPTGDAVRQALLDLYRARIAAAWPRQPERLFADEHGLHVKLKGDDVRDLAPLKGMALAVLELDCPNLHDLSALHGMPLKQFTMVGNNLARLDPLRGMRLTTFCLSSCQGPLDFSILAGMPLTVLAVENCSSVPETDLLRGMPLVELRLGGAAVTDLSALRGAPLTTLVLHGTLVRDLSPLKGMALTRLDLAGSPSVGDLSPLRGMPLSELILAGCTEVRDLSPLAGMPLTVLDASSLNGVHDLSPLKGMPLKSLRLHTCIRVEDLGPLAGLPLRSLDLSVTAVQTLAPLKGMKLYQLYLAGCGALADLSGLEGMPLTDLRLNGCSAVADLSPLRGMPLHTLDLSGCARVTDLGPLKGIPLNVLGLVGCDKVTDLSPLADAVLTDVNLSGCAGLRGLDGMQAMRFRKLNLSGCTGLTRLDGMRGSLVETLTLDGCTSLEQLSGLPGLRLQEITIQHGPRLRDLGGLAGLPLRRLTVDDCPLVQDLAPLAALPLQELTLKHCPRVTDLGPLHGRKLVALDVTACAGLADLGPLRDVPLRRLTINGCPVKDLSPLRGMPLETLRMDKCLELRDLSPLAGLPLREVFLPPQSTDGLAVLRQMATLQTIDGQPAALFWRKRDRPAAPLK